MEQINTNINTNINDYNLNELLSLIDINLNEINESEIHNKISENIDKKIAIFNELENTELQTFFRNIKIKLLGNKLNDNETENEKLLLENNKHYNINKDTSSILNPNQYDRKLITKILTVDSRFRRNYNISMSTNYSINLPYQIHNVIEMKLSELELPTTYYPLNDDYENNYFWLKYTNTNNESSYAYIYINPGNYYHDNLLSNINNFLLTNFISINIKYNLDYNNVGGVGVGDGKIIFELTNPDIKEFELNFYGRKLTDDLPNYNVSHTVNDPTIISDYYNNYSTINYKQRFGWMLGFRREQYTSSNYYMTESILDILGPRYFYLIIDDQNNASNVNFFSNSEKSLISDNIIARISLKNFVFSIHSQGDFKVYTEPRYYYGPVNIDKLHVKLIDEYNRIIDLNKMDFSFTLSLITIYSKTN